MPSDTAMPVTFYLPTAENIEYLECINPLDAWDSMPCGQGAWILQTYQFLKAAGCKVTLSNHIPKKGICVFHRRDKKTLFKQPHKKLSNLTLVGVRGDLHDMLVCDFEILQNRYFSDGIRNHFVPHWPQPNIKPRDTARKNTIKNITFKGFNNQLHKDFQGTEWKQFLDSKNIQWMTQSVEFPAKKPSSVNVTPWSDYSNIDLIIAVRPSSKHIYTNKPASKLINCWFADVPAILGREHAYRELGEPGKDYIEVCNLSETKSAIERLLNEPDYYYSLIENGRKKRQQYSHEAITQCWQTLLFETIPNIMLKRNQRWTHKFSKQLPLSLRYKLCYLAKTLSFQHLR